MLDTTQKLEAYRRMVRIRQFEEEGSRLFKAGKIPGVFHASIGQEAAIVGACLTLREHDTITGTHRSHGHPIGKGAELKTLMAELMAKVTGISKGRGGSMHLADRSVGIIGQSAIVGGGIPIATGAALSAKALGVDRVSMCFFGDGAVNQGTFHESLNMAALWKLPVIYLCENNGYAITSSLEATHAQPNIAKRADAYGMLSFVVDGQDLCAVYDVVYPAVQRARRGDGPTLIEAKTYRFDEHSVGLRIPGKPYRALEEVNEQKKQRDPIALLRWALLADGVLDRDLLRIESEVAAAVQDAIRFGEESPSPQPENLYDNLFSCPSKVTA